jgi:cyclopropane-fatty-acyl-phospholipid synthase
MNAIEQVFTRAGARLPCAFNLHLNGSARKLGPGDPVFDLYVHNEAGERALGSLNELLIAEAYMRGDLDLEGDVVRAMWFRSLLGDSRWLKLWGRLQALLWGRLKMNPGWIAKHYDMGNVQLHAIDTVHRAYTPGIWDSADDTLETSAGKKFGFAFSSIHARPGQRVLDVGCGWGGFTHYCAERGVRVTGLTLSRDQHAYTTRLIAEKGLDAEALYQDFFTYRPERRFDGVTMMGVIEDLSDYDWVMRRLWELVAPGGRVYLDFAAGKVPFATSGFVNKHVWPGTFRMVYMPELMRAIDEARIDLVGVYDDRRNYHLWAKHGHERWIAEKDRVVRESSLETWRLMRLLSAGTAGVMNDPRHDVTAYRMVLEVPADRKAPAA